MAPLFGVLGSAAVLLRGGLTGAMRLLVVRSDLAFTLLRPVAEDLWHWRGGAPIEEAWTEIELTVSDGSAKDFIAVDCLELITGTDGFLLSDFARGKLSELLLPAGEFWPVRVLGRSYWWFNCLAWVEALDRERTDADWGLVEGDWGSFRWITATRKLAFKPERLVSAPALFRVPEYPQGVLFGTDALRQAVRSHELTGFRFDCVWTLEGGGVADPPGLGLAGVFDAASASELAGRRAAAIATLERRGGASA